MALPNPEYEALMVRLAATLDEVRTYIWPQHKVSIVLCDERDDTATIILGQVDEPLLVRHIQAVIDNPANIGVVNRDTGFTMKPEKTN